MADVSKLTGYAVVGPADDHTIVSKAAAYAVVGPADNHIVVSKVTAYAVVGPEEAQPAPTNARRVQNVNFL